MLLVLDWYTEWWRARGRMNQLAWRPYGHKLASASADGTVRLWACGLAVKGQTGSSANLHIAAKPAGTLVGPP
jgi:WD40 repeat protein